MMYNDMQQIADDLERHLRNRKDTTGLNLLEQLQRLMWRWERGTQEDRAEAERIKRQYDQYILDRYDDDL